MTEITGRSSVTFCVMAVLYSEVNIGNYDFTQAWQSTIEMKLLYKWSYELLCGWNTVHLGFWCSAGQMSASILNWSGLFFVAGFALNNS